MKRFGCLYRKRLVEASNLLTAMYGSPKDRLEGDEAGIERKVGELFTDPKRGCRAYLWGQTGRIEVEGSPEAVQELCEQLKQHGLLKKGWTTELCE
jgi:hypothetical protein